MGPEQQIQRTSAQLAESIAELTGELNELKRRKKAFNAEINERIKDLEDQIDCENEQWKKMKEKEGLQ
jgi:uncharacterized protein Yka (UPF0111/DUF47 family)